MLEDLKKFSLVGFAFAIAAGLVLGHLTIKVADDLYENHINISIGIASASALLFWLGWKRKTIILWFRTYRNTVLRWLFVPAASFAAAAAHGGRVYTSLSAAGDSDFDARVQCNRAMAIDLVCIAAVFLLAFGFKRLFRRMRNEVNSPIAAPQDSDAEQPNH
jgi:large-conductance mechanosensitive channel